MEHTLDSPYQQPITNKSGFPIQKQMMPKPLPPVAPPPNHFSHSPSRPSLSPLPAPQSHITIEDGTSISPDRYTDMWDEMDISASFSAQLHPENNIIEQKLVQLVTHLQTEKFFVVAAGEADNLLTIYGFASGFKKSDTATEDSNLDDSMRLGITAVYFLMELKINTDSSLHPQGLWSFECTCKCSHPTSSAVFIKMMLLGDCLHLVKS
jgi:hypothetical protein